MPSYSLDSHKLFAGNYGDQHKELINDTAAAAVTIERS